MILIATMIKRRLCWGSSTGAPHQPGHHHHHDDFDDYDDYDDYDNQSDDDDYDDYDGYVDDYDDYPNLHWHSARCLNLHLGHFQYISYFFALDAFLDDDGEDGDDDDNDDDDNDDEENDDEDFASLKDGLPGAMSLL